MFTAMFLSSLCDFHFNYQISMLTIRANACNLDKLSCCIISIVFKTAMLLAVYEKLLHIPAFKLTDDFSSGKLINLMSTDVERIGGFIASFHAFWSMPMNFTIALYLLYREVKLFIVKTVCFAPKSDWFGIFVGSGDLIVADPNQQVHCLQNRQFFKENDGSERFKNETG